jgi:hypothetical protein
MVHSAPSSHIFIGNTICCVPSASGVKILNLTFIEADMYIHSPRSNLHRVGVFDMGVQRLTTREMGSRLG